jgi:hypothetical protein
MKKTLTTYDIAHALKSDKNANWSWDGARALAEYLEELEQDLGEEMELDVVAIRCDFSESTSLQAWAADHFRSHVEAVVELGLDLDDHGAIVEDSEAIDEAIRSFIQDHGHLIEFDGGVIVSSF